MFVCLSLLAVAVAATRFTGTLPRADLTYVNPSGVHALDPARMSWTQDFRLALNLWEGLTTWDPQSLAPIPAAAHAPKVSNDGTVYTFTLRDDLRWSNGDPVTSHDFVRGWRRGMEPGTAADYVFFFTEHIAGAKAYVQWRGRNIAAMTGLRALAEGRRAGADQIEALRDHRLVPALEAELAPGVAAELADRLLEDHAAEADVRFAEVGISAPDGGTLIVRLSRPCAYFPDLTASPALLPCHESIEVLRVRHRGLPYTPEGLVVFDPQWTKPHYQQAGYSGLVTNGPYRLKDWMFRQRVRLEVNPFHRRAETVRCRTVDMLEYPNVSASLMAYEAGDVDLLTDMTVPYDHELSRLARTGRRSDFHACNVLATYFLNFNCESPEVNGRRNPFVDARVRRAFTLATDRHTLVEQVLGRGDRVAASLVPVDSIAGYQPPAGLGYDPVRANALLQDCGYAIGADLGPIEILCTFNDERLAQALARMWAEALGVQVELRIQESKTLAADKIARRFMVARGNWYADYADPTTFLNCHASGDGNNDSGYADARYDALLTEADRETDEAARMRLLREAEVILVEQDCPVLPILHYSQMIAIKPHVHGLHPNARLWLPFWEVSIER